MPNLKPLSHLVFFFALACQRIFIQTHSIESKCVIGPENYTVCRRVRASFSPEILQAGAVKGLRTCQPYKLTPGGTRSEETCKTALSITNLVCSVMTVLHVCSLDPETKLALVHWRNCVYVYVCPWISLPGFCTDHNTLIQTHKIFKIMTFIRTKYNMRIFGVIPLSSYKTTLKQQLLIGEKR